MKVIKNKKTHSSPSTGTPQRQKPRKKELDADSSTFVIRSMGDLPLGVLHVSDTAPIKGQQELLNYCLSGKRKVTSFRCDGLLWANFKERCRVEGLSTCRVVEKLLLAWITGIQFSRVPNMVVQLDMPRIVKRVRRRQLYFEDEVSVEEVSAGDVQSVVKCGFCDKEAVGSAVHRESGKKVFVCEYHKRCLSEHPKWKVLTS